MERRNFSSGSGYFVSGTPFDPYDGNNGRGIMNARIMPSQFLLPYDPVRFTVLRNTVPDDEEPTSKLFF